MKKGQNSVELLVILAIIIIVLLSVIGTISFLPQINQNLQEDQFRRYWANGDIGILAHHFNSTHGYFRLVNNLDYPIKLKNLSLDGSLAHSSNALINPGEQYDYTFNYSLTKEIYDLTVKVGYFHLGDQSVYYFEGEAPLKGIQSFVTGDIEDSFAPNSVSGLVSTNQTNSSIYWTWTNPGDSDFSECMIYINGDNVVNTSNNYYNATGLNPDTAYIIKIHTKDLVGNVNWTIIDDLNYTLAIPIIFNWYDNFVYNSTWLFENRTETVYLGARLSAPVLYMNFNKPPEGTYVQDNSLYNNFGTNNGATYNASCTGTREGCFEFDGTLDHIVLENITAVDNGSYLTVSIWAKSDGSSDGGIISKYHDSDHVWHIYYDNTANKIYFEQSSGSAAYGEMSITPDTNWHHYAMIFDGTQSTNVEKLKGFIDGVEQPLTFTGTIPNLLNSKGNLEIGRTRNNQEFGGQIDNVQIWDKVLTGLEILSLYNTNGNSIGKYSQQGDIRSKVFSDSSYDDWAINFSLADSDGTTSCTSTNAVCQGGINTNFENLVSYWPLDRSNEDLIGGNDGAANGTNNATGISSEAIRFDGDDDQIDAGNDSSLQIDQEITISVWVKSTEEGYIIVKD